MKKKKEKKEEEKPTTRKYILYCEGCDSSSEHFLLLIEYYTKQVRQVWCRVCDKMTNWSLEKKVLK